MTYESKPGMPRLVMNAPFEADGFKMRVGIPHRGGSLAFSAFEQGYPAMVSASAFWNARTKSFTIPRYTNLDELDYALDSAGFTAMALWKQKGQQAGLAGVFPWSLSQYLELAALSSASWFSQPDLCVEREVASSEAEVDYRIRATATLLEATLRQLYVWHDELARTCSPRVVVNMVKTPVPVLQGRRPDDYLRSLDLMLEVWRRWEPWLAPPALIGIGSMCRRPLRDRQEGLLAVLGALEGRLPPNSRAHLFGVKGACLAHVRTRPWIASADSMAFDITARRTALQQGRSNTVAHRAQAMNDWMERARRAAAPAAGDQARLPLAFFA
jgi:hypothetical protein